jgi:hypothetical protein
VNRAFSAVLHRLGNAPLPIVIACLALCFSVFGIASVNLFLMLRANLLFIGEHGWEALKIGGAAQLGMLALSAYVGMAFYALAKWFEHRVIDRIAAAGPLHAQHGRPAPERTTSRKTKRVRKKT